MLPISVVIPLYNKEKYIQRAIESVISQTVPVDEIIVVDDGSTDNSILELKKIAASNIRLIKQPNQGVSSARNTGVEQSQNEWIAFLDADDEWQPTYISKIQQLAIQYPNCGAYATSYMIQKNGGSTPIRFSTTENWEGILQDYFNDLVDPTNTFYSSSIVVKKSALVLAGGFPIGVVQGEDTNTWIRLSLITNIGLSRNRLVIYHCEAEGRSSIINQLSKNRQNYHHADYLTQLLSRGEIPPEKRQSVIDLIARNSFPRIRDYISDGNRAEAARWLWRCRGTRVFRRKWFQHWKILIKSYVMPDQEISY